MIKVALVNVKLVVLLIYSLPPRVGVVHKRSAIPNQVIELLRAVLRIFDREHLIVSAPRQLRHTSSRLVDALEQLNTCHRSAYQT